MRCVFSSLFKQVKEGFIFQVKVVPRAKVSAFLTSQNITTSFKNPALTKILKISLQAVPEKGRANNFLIKFLADTWSVPQKDIYLLGGQKNTVKTLVIHGNIDDLRIRLEKWIAKNLQAF